MLYVRYRRSPSSCMLCFSTEGDTPAVVYAHAHILLVCHIMTVYTKIGHKAICKEFSVLVHMGR